MEAVGAATAATGVGLGLFGYNRGNYQFDQKLHFSRFTAGYTFANAATKMYRDDISDLTAITTGKLTNFVDNACIGFHIFTAMACPGRLGLHTPPPPSWLSGLFHTNLAAGYIFLALTFWFGMHAVCRSDVAATHLLTRWVRFPIPNTKMLDRARAFLSDYEAQRVGEMLRIPFLKRHPHSSNDARLNEDMDRLVDPEAKQRTRHGLDVPTWYRQEKYVDTGYTFESMMPFAARGTAPEHFEVYREVQNEWWPYDVYCRISMTLAHLHMFHAWSYFQIGHNIVETRALWPAGVVVVCCWTAQMVILTLDIIPKNNYPPIHWLGPLGPVLAYIAMVGGEYRRWYSEAGMYISFVLVFVIHFIHIVYIGYMIMLCSPDYDKPPEAAEVPSRSWWPSSWRLPESWLHSIWLVPPPRELGEGQVDLPGEMRAASQSGSATPHGGGSGVYGGSDEVYGNDLDKRRDVHNALGRQGESPAWRSVKIGLYAILVAWVWLTIGFAVDVAMQGSKHPSLLNAPGLPNHMRDPRYRPAKPGYDEPVEVGVGIEEIEEEEGAQHHRRLGGQQQFQAREMADKLRDVIRNLEQLVEPQPNQGPVLPIASTDDLPSRVLEGFEPRRAAVTWPALFEPRVLACSANGTVVALSARGRGVAITSINDTLDTAWEFPVQNLTSFTLEGVASMGPLAAAWVDDAGLIVASSSGRIAECSSGTARWRCTVGHDAPVPVLHPSGMKLLAISRDGVAARSALKAVVAAQGEGTAMVLSRSSATAPWLPVAEVRLPAPAVAATFNHQGHKDSLLFLVRDGSTVEMSLMDGSTALIAEAAGSQSGHSWQAICGMPQQQGHMARLGSRPIGAALSEPTLLLGA